MMPVTLTGCPDSLVGENFALRAAATATACNNGCPETACAEVTLPFSSTVTWTMTVPEAFAVLAIGGYAGLGKLIAFPFNTPPEIVLLAVLASGSTFSDDPGGGAAGGSWGSIGTVVLGTSALSSPDSGPPMLSIFHAPPSLLKTKTSFIESVPLSLL